MTREETTSKETAAATKTVKKEEERPHLLLPREPAWPRQPSPAGTTPRCC